MTAYYNENDPQAAAWLRWLIANGAIPPGDVDERSIADVQPDDLAGYRSCHFFAGIGGWAYAARLAGWPDDHAIWTGSCPCQPFSVAGRGKGTKDRRHLWPHFFRLIRAARPAVVMGEQVAGTAGYGWFDGVRSDLESALYASRAVDVPACSVDAPHIRSRLYWLAVADRAGERRQRPRVDETGERSGQLPDRGYDGGLANSNERRHGDRAQRNAEADNAGAPDGAGRLADTPGVGSSPWYARTPSGPSEFERPAQQPERRHDRGLGHRDHRHAANLRDAGSEAGAGLLPHPGRPNGTFWDGAEWTVCHDGKARRTQPGTPLLAHGVPFRVAKWRGLGNAIVPQVAAQVIAAFMETMT